MIHMVLLSEEDFIGSIELNIDECIPLLKKNFNNFIKELKEKYEIKSFKEENDSYFVKVKENNNIIIFEMKVNYDCPKIDVCRI